MGEIVMKQEDKELLLKDLCARLPYGVFCNIGLDYPLSLQRLSVDKLDGILLDFYEDGKDYQVYLGEVKPYLFPLSSMTDKQKGEYNGLKDMVPSYYFGYGAPEEDFAELYDNWRSIDYLNANHFDYRGLIEDGLAIDATGLNIY